MTTISAERTTEAAIAAFLGDPTSVPGGIPDDLQMLLGRFAADVGPDRALSSVTTADLWRWVTGDRDAQQPRLNSLRWLYRWCYIHGFIEDNPVIGLRLSHEHVVTPARRRPGLQPRTPAQGTANYHLIIAFERHQRRRRLSDRTIESRRQTLRDLVEFLGDKPLTTVSMADLETFLESRGEVIKPNTSRTYLGSIRALFAWMAEHELRPDDPATRIRGVKVPRGLPRPISEADLARALDAAQPRIRTWLCLGAYEGFRCIEMARLRVEDIRRHGDPPMLLVAGKGSKDRTVPLHPRTLAALDAFGLPRTGYVFTRRDGLPLKPGTVSVAIGTFLHGLGINSSAHPLRHRFATRVYAETKDIRLVQELLGHANPATTAIYAAYNPHEAVAAVNRL